MRVIFYVNTDNGRAKAICVAVTAGLARHGQAVEVVASVAYRAPQADLAISYGLWGPLRKIHEDYRAAGRATLLIDLGYWGRIEGGKLAGYHKLAVNGRHATAYFQRVKHPPDRFRRFGIEPQPFRRTHHESRITNHVLLCGMSDKAAWVYGLRAEEWERQAVERLRRATRREIRYRPKPSFKGAQPLDGAQWAPAHANVLMAPRDLDDCWAVVTHHGNTAFDALIAGLPVFCEHGLASVLGSGDLGLIETPRYPDEAARDQLLYDAAYTQFKVCEIADGTAWAHLLDEKLVEQRDW